MTDFLNRTVISLDSINTTNHNLTHVPSIIADYLENIDIDSLSDNDRVVVSKVCRDVLVGNTKLYMADCWTTLAWNFDMLVISEKNYKTIDIKSLYKDDNHWTKTVISAKNIISKTPPPQFVSKWPILGSEEFRNRMKDSDNDSVITLNMAMVLSKNNKLEYIYQTDDWELLLEMINNQV